MKVRIAILITVCFMLAASLVPRPSVTFDKPDKPQETAWPDYGTPPGPCRPFWIGGLKFWSCPR